MNSPQYPIVYIPGAGGGAPDLSVFKLDDESRVEALRYPSWQKFSNDGLSAEGVIAGLVEQIEAKVPSGPIRLVGLSLGGHFGYALALRLQAKGREIASFCAIDTFMIHTTEPGSGWKQRALGEAIELIRKRRFSEFAEFLRSKFWRLLIRLASGRLTNFLARFSSVRSSSAPVMDPILEGELSMRLLLKEMASWLPSLDINPVPLETNVLLIRTKLTAGDDAAWLLRCPSIKVAEVPGHHQNLFFPENVGFVRAAYLAAMQTGERSTVAETALAS